MKLNSLFQNGAVFQRHKNIPVWGKAIPSHLLKAEFGGTVSWARSSASGDFTFFLPPFEAGGPYTLTIIDTESNETVTVSDILVGEVWLASGQSNMSYMLESDWALDVSVKREDKTSYKQLQEFIASTSKATDLRFFKVAQCASGCRETEAVGQWHSMADKEASQCSAVAAWFGKYIHECLGIPVGLIVTAWGGTIAEAWTSPEALMTNPDTALLVNQLETRMRDEEAWEANSKESTTARLSKPDPGNEGFGKGWAAPEFNDADWKRMQIPGSWKQQGIAGNGAIWVRRKVSIPQAWDGKELVLRTGGIDKHDTAYFNGVEIGRTGTGLEVNWFCVPREYTIPAELVHAGENTIAIRAFSFLWEGAFWGGDNAYVLALKGTDETIPIAGEWVALAEFDWGNLSMNNLQPISFGRDNPNTPGILFDAMLYPLLPYAIQGAIWYQGETNAPTLEASRQYLAKLKTMITDWRFHFRQGNFPFIQVQLANYHDPVEFDKASPWALLREAQRLVCNALPEVYMASAIDIGESVDIHPQDKKSVGKRLADNALTNVYGLPGLPSGPLYRGFRRELNRIRLFFDHADGLCIKQDSIHDADASRGFILIEADGNAVPADSVVVEGNTIVVSSAKCAEPVGVKYAWADNPPSTIYNSASLPASTFSTLDEF